MAIFYIVFGALNTYFAITGFMEGSPVAPFNAAAVVLCVLMAFYTANE